MNIWRLYIPFCGLVFIVFALGSGTGCSTAINSSPLWTPSMPDSLLIQSPVIDVHQLELTIHHNANIARRDLGIPELRWNDDISFIARNHSKDMAKNAYFGHINKRGESASERARKAGFSSIQTNRNYSVVGIGENIYATHHYEEYSVSLDSLDRTHYYVKWKDTETIAREAVDAWLQSLTHRNNLLSTAYTVQGIGVSIGSNGTIFVTQNFN